ncbi:MAG: divergent polysaccharide deacetylase family protein [Myxococcales bacterium]|nr:divergent polysaccharide deacetylase family protein [Myxococcales bacterium]
MLDRQRSTLLDRIGRQLADFSGGLRFAIALAGFAFFIGLSSLGWVTLTDQLLPRTTAAAAATAESPPPAAAKNDQRKLPFTQRLETITDIAKSCFLDVGLSREHFITQLTDPRQYGTRQFDYYYWEVWVPPDFDVEQILDKLREHKGVRAENVSFEYERIDEKTYAIKAYVDGINTHQFLFTKAAQEVPEGARVLLANVPENVTKIDIGAIPTISYQGAPRLAIIVDDIGTGVREAVDRLFLNLPAKITLSILPYGATARQMAELAHQNGNEVMLHLPMEPLDMKNNDPGHGKLLLAMNDADIRQTIDQDLKQVPFIAGVNNHMGSAFTRNGAKMSVVLQSIKERNLFFIDSVTIGDSVAFTLAKQNGIHSAARNLFLDHSPDLDSIRRQVELAGRIAKAQGKAIAIGHPFQNTYQALQEGLPKLRALGIEIVPVGQLVQ